MKKFLFIIISFVFIPNITQAAVLYLESAEYNYYQGDSFIAEMRIDTEEECINTVKADLNFPQDLLEVVDFSQGNSILTILLQKPEISQEQGLISFTGGIPGGYCGVLPGDPGKSNLLAKIIFKVKEISGEQFSAKTAKVGFKDSSQVLLNDGFGTPAELKTRPGLFNILSGIPDAPKKEWQEELNKDVVPPEQFKIEISRDQKMFSGKYFIIFSTTDKETGVGYYEAKEGKRDWKPAESPYLLEDQSLTSIIKVRAVDKAGNERVAELPAQEQPLPWRVIVLILIIGAGVIIWKLKTQNKNSKITS